MYAAPYALCAMLCAVLCIAMIGEIAPVIEHAFMTINTALRVR